MLWVQPPPPKKKPKNEQTNKQKKTKKENEKRKKNKIKFSIYPLNPYFPIDSRETCSETEIPSFLAIDNYVPAIFLTKV